MTALIILAIVASRTLTIKSPAFANNDFIPVKYSCNGANINPELIVSDIPEGTRSLALVIDDPDASKGTFDHWVMWNIPVKDKIEEDSAPGAQGRNSKNENKYIGPCPPSGTHHYHFRIYALDTKLDLPVSTDKHELLKAIDGHILAVGLLTGLFKNK